MPARVAAIPPKVAALLPPEDPDRPGVDALLEPDEELGTLKAALAENKKTAEFKIYPGAPHGFHADYRASYRKEAAEDGWNNMQAWFKKYKVLG